jgi:hypothetical protein
MTKLATLCYDEATSTWSAQYEGETLIASKGGPNSRKYVIKRLTTGECARAIALGVTGFDNLPVVGPQTTGVPTAFAPSPNFNGGVRHKPNNLLPVAERYELLDEMVDLVLQDIGIRSLIITGEGSLGKTFHTKQKIKERGLLSTEEAEAIAYTLTPEEEIVKEKILHRVKECKKIAEAYYKANPVKADAEDDEVSAEEKEDFELEIGEINFTNLHTSREIDDRVCAGQFFPGSNKYNFNIKLAVQNPEEFYDVVVPHEMAHHIQSILFPKSLKIKKGHGKDWGRIMSTVFEIPAARFHQMDTTDMKNAPELEGDYHYVKGFTSPKGLYRTMFENRRKLIIYDDCDAAWKNDIGANLLKAALDSDDERWITWNVEGSDTGDLPKRFLFEGRIIFISNVASEDFPQPLISRSLRADVELTVEETFERMRQILPSEKFAPGISMEVKQMAYDFLYENREFAGEITSRSLLNVVKVANSGSKLWKRIAMANIA